LSVLEDEPADRVAPGLVLKDECPNLLVKLVALPVTFDASGAGVARVHCSHGLDRIGRGTEIMLRHVAYASCLTSGIGGIPSGPHQGVGRAHRVSAACPSVHHLHIPTGPGACCLDRLAWASIQWLVVLEEVQHVFRALRGPQRQEVMISISERSATANRDQARVTDLREDHPNQHASRARGMNDDLDRSHANVGKRARAAADADVAVLGGLRSCAR